MVLRFFVAQGLQFGLFRSVARSGQDSLAQGLPGFTLGLVPSEESALKGPIGTESSGFQPGQRAHLQSRPFRANSGG
jgi:hypothetical protein